MYDRRLSAWGVSKNISSAKKQKIINMLVETGTWANDISPSKDRHINIDQKDFNKIIRHAKSQRRQRTSKVISHPKYTTIVRRRQDTPNESPCSDSASYSSSPKTEPSTPLNCEISSQIEAFEFSSPESDADEVFGITSQSDLIFIPAPPVPYNNSVNTAKLLQNVNIYIDKCRPSKRYVEPSFIDREGFEIVCPSDTFWLELKNGIYLLKVQSPELAWPALDKACDLAPAVITSKMSAELGFLRELFLTLSPVNTRIFPKIRTVLLQYLSYLSCLKLSPTHPLAVICHELQQDEQSVEVSELALNCMLGTLRATSNLSSQSEAEAFRLECAAVKLTRRDGQLRLAADKARALYDRCLQRLGNDDSEQAMQQLRKAATELAHVCMDLRGNSYDEAIDLCLFVLTGMLEPTTSISEFPPHPSDFASFIGDEKSVYTLEDLAKIYEELGATEHAIEWLERAEDLACELFGNQIMSTATAHIVDKLEKLRTRSKM